MKHHYFLSLVLLPLGMASAATISYDFENPANITDAGSVDEAYSAPDTNDFGTGVTVSAFTMTDRDALEYSRFTDIGNGSVLAAVGNGSTALTASFTVTIDDTVMVDLTSISFDSFFRFVLNNNNANIVQTFSTSIGDNETVSSWTKDSNVNLWPNPDNTVSVLLSGLTGLTDTSVTFTWSFEDNKSNTFANLTHGIDDIELIGTVSPVPEPSSVGLLVSGLSLLSFLRRRR
ncbi:MAG: PEP-CTERM sorting domain-containing protein [Verrucomicrobiales bacterium]